jgi:hypothetical protein
LASVTPLLSVAPRQSAQLRESERPPSVEEAEQNAVAASLPSPPPMRRGTRTWAHEYANRHYRTQDNGQNEGGAVSASDPSREMRVDRRPSSTGPSWPATPSRRGSSPWLDPLLQQAWRSERLARKGRSQRQRTSDPLLRRRQVVFSAGATRSVFSWPCPHDIRLMLTFSGLLSICLFNATRSSEPGPPARSPGV